MCWLDSAFAASTLLMLSGQLKSKIYYVDLMKIMDYSVSNTNFRVCAGHDQVLITDVEALINFPWVADHYNFYKSTVLQTSRHKQKTKSKESVAILISTDVLIFLSEPVFF